MRGAHAKLSHKRAARRLVAYSGKYFHCGQISPAAPNLWNPAAGEAENRRNEERNQGHDEYDLCGCERGPSDDAEAERAGEQSNDKKGDRPAEHDILLALHSLLS
jgi:hypothetical protein